MKHLAVLILILLLLGCSSSSVSPIQITPDASKLATQIPASIFGTQTATRTKMPRPSTTAIQVLLLSGLPAQWLPSQKEIPAELVLDRSYPITNEDVSKTYTNQPDVLEKLNQWGRVTASENDYINKDGCNAKRGLRALWVETVLFQSASGAQQEEEWYYTKNLLDSTHASYLPDIGDAATLLWQKDTSDCKPTDNLRIANLGFRRYNVVGSVIVFSVDGTVSEADMQSLAVGLAKSIDAKLLANAK